ncbi:uncharacterized protein LOC121102602 [Ursus maritimus]|uniref:Uncharacterized protein LOC121102602 n=1 Tax=Ursus maritimus TaxID=29073 RepID=A0A8M1FUI5_URSMA|nr:uncharacterized protein LOC121102602 [Ursus maritimus]
MTPGAGGDAARRGWALVPAGAPGWMLAALTPDGRHGPESESRTGPPAAGPRPQRSVCVMEIRQPCRSGIPLPASGLGAHLSQNGQVDKTVGWLPFPPGCKLRGRPWGLTTVQVEAQPRQDGQPACDPGQPATHAHSRSWLRSPWVLPGVLQRLSVGTLCLSHWSPHGWEPASSLLEPQAWLPRAGMLTQAHLRGPHGHPMHPAEHPPPQA